MSPHQWRMFNAKVKWYRHHLYVCKKFSISKVAHTYYSKYKICVYTNVIHVKYLQEYKNQAVISFNLTLLEKCNYISLQRRWQRLIHATFFLFSGRKTLNYLFWDGGIAPILRQVNFRNQAVMVRSVGHEDNRENDDSIRHYAGTEQKKGDQLETSPLAQKSCGVLIIPHRCRTEELCTSVFVCQKYLRKRISCTWFCCEMLL